MGLQSLTDVLAAAQREGRAATGLTCYDLATGAGAISAAESCRASLVLIVSVPALLAPSGPGLVAGLRRLAEAATVPVAIQLDHVSDVDQMARALAAGANALMVDGSRLTFDANVGLVSRGVALAREFDAEVEGELGRLEGDEEIAREAVRGELTDPADILDFLGRSGALCLAVAVGNVHGLYRGAPEMDWGRLAEITAVSDRPISLHGASGLRREELRRAVGAGVAKVNFNTVMRQRWIAAVTGATEEARDGARMLGIQAAIAAAARDFVTETIGALTVPSTGIPPRSPVTSD